MKLFKTVALAALVVLFFNCEGNKSVVEDSTSTLDELQFAPISMNLDAKLNGKPRRVKNDDVRIRNWMADFNRAIEDQGIFIEKVEFLGAEEAGRTVFFKNVGNKQSGSDWVPNDPRYGNGAGNFGSNVPYWIDNTQLGTSSGMSDQETFDAIVNAMDTWDALTCSKGLNIPNLGNSNFDAGLVQFFEGYGGSQLTITGTILHAGVLPAEFFENVLGPGSGEGTLGVTFTFSYTDTDLDGNGRADRALSEIYMNDGFNWQDEPNDVLGNGIYDFETVLLHEVGHGLSQGHFGTAFIDSGQGYLHFSPAALMNAGYTVGRREVTQTDESGHCSIWGEWPNR